MRTRFGFTLIVGSFLVASSALAAERYELRAPGGVGAATSNEVGVWKTVKAARGARSSLVIGNQFMSPNLECIVRPGTKAEVIKREGSVAYVRASNAAFGGCKGFVKTEFLSAS
ncbi:MULTISPECIES: succinate dehydrogenase [Ensifer]|uniref:succinate dehydrogenase n=1 Tax=Ensifer TaxID=106591 RepID=UPI0008074417|nr:succinate dehydrogenase [Ensifer adhaerens]